MSSMTNNLVINQVTKKNNFWRHEHIQSLANNKRFNCMQHVVLGALVMLIENINLKVGATNGTIGKNQFKTNMIFKDIFTKHHFL